MREVTELLDSILGQTTFDSRSAKKMTPAQLRDAFERNGWHDEEIVSAREAEPNIPDELLSQLKHYLRPLLQKYIISGNRLYGYGQAIDFIGHAFPIDESGYATMGIPPKWRKLIYSPDYFDMTYMSRVSTMENFTKGVTKGAAVLGSERVTQLLSDWLEGKPVKYRISAILNGPPVKAPPLTPFDGVHIEPLPQSSDRLDATLPRRRGTSEKVAFDYLGRTLVSIDVEVKPALFHPTELSPQNVQIEPIGGVNIATVCQALSLESDGYVDAGFYWHDYQELDAFSLSVDQTTWTMGNARDRNWSIPVTWRNNQFTNVTTLEFKRDQPMLDLSETEFIRTLSALKTLKISEKTRIAVSRWVKSKDSGAHLEDRFIDLRVALESLYLQHIGNEQYRGEMGLRLSLCGAWHLGVDFEQRKKIRKNLQDAYNTASKAVHGDNLDYIENQQLLSTAQDLCRRGILKLLKEGSPRDWTDLILGIENE
ncbi:MAG: HEPN domain-containing protein [Caldilineaceae bacterium]|nr:HEPN domain-containing protein [Caldilineaceae bacterium]